MQENVEQCEAVEFKPFKYQQYCIDKIVNTAAVGLFIEMGLGKTVITLSAIAELKYNRWQVGRVLVIAPKKVAESVWHKEAAKWKNLNFLSFSAVLGSEEKRIAALHQEADIYLINRENVQWLVEYYKYSWPFDMVVIDESSSFKSHAAKRFKALKSIRSHISRIVELTGTPSPHGLLDLWSQVYLLDCGKRLGKTITAYRDAYFVPDKRGRDVVYSYTTRQGADKEIFERISDICISMKAEDYIELPEMIFSDIPVMLDDVAKKAYKRLERDALLSVDDEIITANTAAALTTKLLQLCNGAVYSEDGSVKEIHRCKLEVLLETIERLNGEHAIVCYNFKHDRMRLLDVLKSTGLRYAVYEGLEQQNEWNAGNLDLLLVQPASCGYGLNLQDGGHHVIWFGLNWNLEFYTQTNKRLHRQGQRYPVIIHNLIVQGGMDEDVMRSLAGKERNQQRLIEALKAKVQEAKRSIEG